MGGIPEANEYLTLAYSQLRRIAASYLRRDRPGLTLQPTALVHEAFLRLMQNGDLRVVDRTHFLAVSAHVMRQILVDRFRTNGAAKRNPPASGPELHDPLFGPGAVRVLALHDALDRLQLIDPGQAEIVEMRFFAGMTSEEVADHLGVSLRTVNREWSTARTWLRRELRKAGL